LRSCCGSGFAVSLRYVGFAYRFMDDGKKFRLLLLTHINRGSAVRALEFVRSIEISQVNFDRPASIRALDGSAGRGQFLSAANRHSFLPEISRCRYPWRYPTVIPQGGDVD
jgi:hypothetical protein